MLAGYTHNSFLFFFAFCLKFMRMPPESFKYLLNVLGPFYNKKKTRSHYHNEFAWRYIILLMVPANNL